MEVFDTIEALHASIIITEYNVKIDKKISKIIKKNSDFIYYFRHSHVHVHYD